VGVAVNVHPVPVQPGLLPLVSDMLMAGFTLVVTFAVMIFDPVGATLPDKPKIILGRFNDVLALVFAVQMVVVAPSTALKFVAVKPGLDMKFW
jgi:hypothetical protein